MLSRLKRGLCKCWPCIPIKPETASPLSSRLSGPVRQMFVQRPREKHAGHSHSPDRAERRLQSLLKRLFLSAADNCAGPSLRIRAAAATVIRAATSWRACWPGRCVRGRPEWGGRGPTSRCLEAASLPGASVRRSLSCACLLPQVTLCCATLPHARHNTAPRQEQSLRF
jgi:hypothetical protein